MLLLELLSRLQNSHTSRLFWNLFTGLIFLNELNIKSFLSLTKLSIPLNITLWYCIYSATSWSQHTLFTLRHSDQTSSSLKVTHRSFRHVSPNVGTSFLRHSEFLEKLPSSLTAKVKTMHKTILSTKYKTKYFTPVLIAQSKANHKCKHQHHCI